MKPKNRYMVMALEKEHGVFLHGRKAKLSLIWTDRMCGVRPVF